MRDEERNNGVLTKLPSCLSPLSTGFCSNVTEYDDEDKWQTPRCDMLVQGLAKILVLTKKKSSNWIRW